MSTKINNLQHINYLLLTDLNLMRIVCAMNNKYKIMTKSFNSSGKNKT